MSKQSRCRECAHTPGPRPPVRTGRDGKACECGCHMPHEVHSRYGPTPSRRQLQDAAPAPPVPRKVPYGRVVVPQPRVSAPRRR
jgi:hypothetical protein